MIERLRSIATPDTPHAEDELPSIQKALAAAGEPDRVVVITNSWRAAHAVATRREHTGDDSGDSYVTERGVPVVHIVSDQSSFAVLIDPRASVQVLRGTVRPERAGEKFDDDLHLLLGVSELTDTERAELTKPERDARTLVRIRVVDRFDVEAIDNPRVVWCATGDN